MDKRGIRRATKLDWNELETAGIRYEEEDETQDLKEANAAAAAEERLPVGRDEDEVEEARVVPGRA